MRKVQTRLLATVLFLTLGLTVSCSSSSDRTVVVDTVDESAEDLLSRVSTTETVKEDMDLLYRSLSADDYAAIQATIGHYVFTGTTPEGRTYKSMLEEGRVIVEKMKQEEGAKNQSPLDRMYNEDSFSKDMELLEEILTENELQTVQNAVITESILGDGLEGLTYGELLSRETIRDKEDLWAKKKTSTNELALLGLTEFRCVSKRFVDKGDESVITYKMMIKNNSLKDMKSVQGRMVLMDTMTNESLAIRVTHDREVIKSGVRVMWDDHVDYDPARPEDQKLKSKDLAEFFVTWIPEKIIFTDGTVLE